MSQTNKIGHFLVFGLSNVECKLYILDSNAHKAPYMTQNRASIEEAAMHLGAALTGRATCLGEGGEPEKKELTALDTWWQTQELPGESFPVAKFKQWSAFETGNHIPKLSKGKKNHLHLLSPYGFATGLVGDAKILFGQVAVLKLCSGEHEVVALMDRLCRRKDKNKKNPDVILGFIQAQPGAGSNFEEVLWAVAGKPRMNKAGVLTMATHLVDCRVYQSAPHTSAFTHNQTPAVVKWVQEMFDTRLVQDPTFAKEVLEAKAAAKYQGMEAKSAIYVGQASFGTKVIPSNQRRLLSQTRQLKGDHAGPHVPLLRPRSILTCQAVCSYLAWPSSQRPTKPSR